MGADELMILGRPGSGKTHYGGQLYGRLQRRPGALTLQTRAGTPTNLALFEEVLSALQEGRAARHTPTATWDDLVLPLQTASGRPVHLAWPDYGGEQVDLIRRQRRAPPSWQARLKSSKGWVVLIRLRAETTYPDAMDELVRRARPDAAAASEDEARLRDWDANAAWVELMQLLLHVAGVGSLQRVTKKRLCVILSCYDELDAGDCAPREVLRARLPLLSAYLESVWAPEALSVWGLSALGEPLDKDSANERFIDDGPESRGWVVLPDGGEANPDLTLPLAWLLEHE